MNGFNWDNESISAQIAHDQAQTQSRKNQQDGFYRGIPEADYGLEDVGTPISTIFLEMVQNNEVSRLYYKDQIFWDVDDSHDALNDVCIQLGLDSEVYTLDIKDDGHQVEIRL